MARLVRSLAALVVTAAIAVGCSKATESNTAALRWLERSCNVSSRHRAETALRRAGAPAENTLIVAYRRGPSARRLDEVSAQAASEYDEIAEALLDRSTYGLSARAVAAVRAIRKSEYVRSAREDYDRGYRAAALAGLGVLRLPRGIALLREVAADPGSPDRSMALKALRFASRPPQP